ncbi:MAG: O-antigen ligase family protein [Anaerolineales bacterium]|nr:O-antigen ligase family protein [Anaerolineales bacterium]
MRRSATYALLPALSLFAAVMLANMVLLAPIQSVPPRMLMLWCASVGVYALTLSAPHIARRVLIWAGLVLAAMAIMEQSLTGARPGWLMNPNLYASGLLLVAPWAWQTGRWRFATVLVALAATGSRGAWVAGLMPVAVRYAPVLWRTRRRHLIAFGVVAIVILGLLVAFRPATVWVRVQTYAEAARLFSQRPLLGWGVGMYPILARVELAKSHADNALLTIAAEMGALGVGAWGLVIYRVIQVAQRSQSPARWALLAWLGHQLVDDTFGLPMIAAMVMANVALLEVEIGMPETGLKPA